MLHLLSIIHESFLPLSEKAARPLQSSAQHPQERERFGSAAGAGRQEVTTNSKSSVGD